MKAEQRCSCKTSPHPWISFLGGSSKPHSIGRKNPPSAFRGPSQRESKGPKGAGREPGGFNPGEALAAGVAGSLKRQVALWDSVKEETWRHGGHGHTLAGAEEAAFGVARLATSKEWGPRACREALATPATPGPAWEVTSVLLPLSWAPAAVGICWQWSAEMA